MVDICKYKWRKTLYERGKERTSVTSKTKRKLLKRVISWNIFPTVRHLHVTYWRGCWSSLYVAAVSILNALTWVISVLESEDAGYFYALKRENCERNVKYIEIEDFQGKNHIYCYMKHMFCMFHFVTCVVLFLFFSVFHWRNVSPF